MRRISKHQPIIMKIHVKSFSSAIKTIIGLCIVLLFSVQSFGQTKIDAERVAIPYVDGQAANFETNLNKSSQSSEVFYDFDNTLPETYYTYSSGTYDGTTISAEDWFLDASEETYQNGVSLRNGIISHNESVNISLLVNVASEGGTLQFKYRTSTESGYDFLKLDINNSRRASFSGEISWRESDIYDLEPGEYYIDFWYTKDGSFDGGLDAVFIDDIHITGLVTSTSPDPDPDSDLHITNVAPKAAAPGSQVEIHGIGFSSSASQNTVSFSGHEAEIISSTAYKIVAKVPFIQSGPTEVKVENSSGSASYAENISVLERVDVEFAFLNNISAASPLNVITADVNGDGNLDIIYASNNGNRVSWFYGYGDGSFGSESIIHSPISSARVVAAGDIDNDGDIDIISGGYADNTIRLHINTGNGTFSTTTVISYYASGVWSLHLADLNRDGFLDLIAGEYTSGEISWFINNTNGTFGPELLLPGTNTNVRSVYAADINNNGYLDIITGSISNKLDWYPSDGSSFIGPNVISTSNQISSLVAADINNDGYQDLIVGSPDGNIKIYENNGDSNFNVSTLTTSGGNIQHVEVADIDGDGDQDILYSSLTDNKISYLLNNRNGNYSSPIALPGSYNSAYSFTLADVDNDGDLDVVSGNFNTNNISVVLNVGTPALNVVSFMSGNNVMQNTDDIQIDFNQDLSAISNFQNLVQSSTTITDRFGNPFAISSVFVEGQTVYVRPASLFAADTLYLRIEMEELYYESPEFYTTYIADFNTDYRVDFEDLAQFSNGWRNNDFQYETAPLLFSSYGFPVVRVNRNNTFDIDDLVNFIRFWNLSEERNSINTKQNLLAKQAAAEQEITANGILKAVKKKQPALQTDAQHSLVTYTFSISNSDSLYALSLMLDYDAESVEIINITNEGIFDVNGTVGTIFLSKVDSLNGLATINIANYSEVKPIQNKAVFSVTFKSLNDSPSDFIINTDYRLQNKLKFLQTTQHTLEFQEELPQEFGLSQNYPNPFNPTTTIPYILSEQSNVSLEVYDIVGRKIESLLSQNEMAAGMYNVSWDASNYASGMYIYVLNIESASGKKHVFTKKMMLVK